MNTFIRTKALIGDRAFNRLTESHVVLCGCGGVGSYVLEALVRTGIGKITLIDGDKVAESNINRQLIATYETVGMSKTDAAVARAKSINPRIELIGITQFLSRDNIADILPSNADYIIDAIDFVPAKVGLAVYADKYRIPIITCLGTGNRLDASKFELCDIYKTSGCPLARKMRCELKKAGIKKLDVLFSRADVLTPDTIIDAGKKTVGSTAYVPAVAGLLIAQHVITKLTEEQ